VITSGTTGQPKAVEQSFRADTRSPPSCLALPPAKFSATNCALNHSVALEGKHGPFFCAAASVVHVSSFGRLCCNALAETASAAPYLVSIDRPAESLQPQLTDV
jgi:hypothetical protein